MKPYKGKCVILTPTGEYVRGRTAKTKDINKAKVFNSVTYAMWADHAYKDGGMIVPVKVMVIQTGLPLKTNGTEEE